MSGRFADAVRWRQIAGRRQREQLAAREWHVLALHSRLLGGEPRPRWSVGDRRLSSEYNRAVNYGVRDVVPRCERGRYIERRLLALFGTERDVGVESVMRREADVGPTLGSRDVTDRYSAIFVEVIHKLAATHKTD